MGKEWGEIFLVAMSIMIIVPFFIISCLDFDFGNLF